MTRGQAAQQSEDPVWAAVQSDEDIDQREFADTLSRNLSSGRFLLLIVGDGIREGMERMAAYLQRTPSLQFTLALVEMATYRLDAERDEPLLVQPRVVARTQEVIRAVVRIEGEAPAGTKIGVEVPSEGDDGGGRRTTITEEEFYEQLKRGPYGGSEAAAFAQELIRELGDTQITIDWRRGGPALKYISEAGKPFSFGALQRSGEVWLDWLADQCRRAEIASKIAVRYFQGVNALVPGSALVRKAERGVVGVNCPAHKGKHVHIPDLIPQREAWLRLMVQTVAQIREALGEEG